MLALVDNDIGIAFLDILLDQGGAVLGQELHRLADVDGRAWLDAFPFDPVFPVNEVREDQVVFQLHQRLAGDLRRVY